MPSNWSSFNRPSNAQLQSNNLRNGITQYNQSSPAFDAFHANLKKTNAPVTRAATGATGSGNSTSGTNGLPGSVEEALQNANAKNEERYGQILGLYDTMSANAKGFGDKQMTDLNRAQQGRRTSANQSLIGRGLGNTTVVDSVQAGINREGDEAGAAIRDLSTRQQNDILQGKAGAIERRSDLGPDLALAAALQRASSGALLNSQFGFGGGGGFGRQSADPSVFGASLTGGGGGYYDDFVASAHRGNPPNRATLAQLAGRGQQRRLATSADFPFEGSGYDTYYEDAPMSYEDAIMQQTALDEQDALDFWSDYEAAQAEGRSIGSLDQYNNALYGNSLDYTGYGDPNRTQESAWGVGTPFAQNRAYAMNDPQQQVAGRYRYAYGY